MTHFECVSVAVSLVYSLVLAKLLGGLPSALRPEKRYWVHSAVQLKGNTKAVRSTGAQHTHDTLIGAYFELARDANLSRIFRMGTLDFDALNEDQKGQFFAFWSGVMYIVQNWLYQRDSGSLDAKLVDSFLGGVAANFHADGFEVFWDQRKFTFSVELKEWDEDIRARPPARSGHVPLGVSRP